MASCSPLQAIEIDTNCSRQVEDPFMVAISNARSMIIRQVLKDAIGGDVRFDDYKKVRFISHPARIGFVSIEDFVFCDIVLGQIIATETHILFKPNKIETKLDVIEGLVTNFIMSESN